MTVIYEINTLVWLRELSERYGRRVTLGDVPGEVWDEVALPGLDAVWLMRVWNCCRWSAFKCVLVSGSECCWSVLCHAPRWWCRFQRGTDVLSSNA